MKGDAPVWSPGDPPIEVDGLRLISRDELEEVLNLSGDFSPEAARWIADRVTDEDGLLFSGASLPPRRVRRVN